MKSCVWDTVEIRYEGKTRVALVLEVSDGQATKVMIPGRYGTGPILEVGKHCSIRETWIRNTAIISAVAWLIVVTALVLIPLGSCNLW